MKKGIEKFEGLLKRNANHFAIGTLISRFSGMLRDMVTSAAFGTSVALAEFMAAYRLSFIWRRLFGEGALNVAFVPQYESVVLREGHQAGLNFFRKIHFLVASFLTFFLLFVGTITYFSPILFPWLDPDPHFIFLNLIMLPGVLFSSLFSINAAMLQTQGDFFKAASAPTLFNLVWIVTALYSYGSPAQEAMPWLSCAVVLAGIAEWTTTHLELRKYTSRYPRNANSYLLSSWKDPDVRLVLLAWAASALGVGAAQINSAIDPIFARYADPEGPAYLWFAMRLEQLPFALFGIGIASVLLPPLSQAAKNRDWDNYAHYFCTAVKRWNRLMIPTMYLLLLLAVHMIVLIYDHGDFAELSVRQTTRCTWAYTLGILPSSLLLVLTSSFYALSQYSIPMRLSFLTIGINVLLNTLFIWVFHLGAVSIAISTSIASWVNCIIVLFVIKRFLPDLYSHFKPLYANGLIHLIAGAIAAASTMWIACALLNDPSYIIWSQSAEDLTSNRTFLSAIEGLFTSTFLFALFYGALIKLPLPFVKKYMAKP